MTPDADKLDPITRDDITVALRDVLTELAANVRDPRAELAAALDSGRNVRRAPSDVCSFYNVPVVLNDPSTQLVPADEQRVRVTITDHDSDGTGTVWLSARPGAVAGEMDTMPLVKGSPLVLDTRAPIYACVTTATTVVAVVVEQANYTL